MKNKHINELLNKLVKDKGTHYLAARLIDKRVSTSTADKIARKKYSSDLDGPLLTVVELVLKEAGYPVKGKAS